MKEKINKGIWILNLIIIFGILVSFNIVIGSADVESLSGNVVLGWKGNYGDYEVYIDEDSSFESPLIYRVTGEKLYLDSLEPGIYFWRVKHKGILSQVGKFEVVSNVGLDVVEEDDKVLLRNSGSVDEEVSFEGITGGVVLELDKGEIKEVENSEGGVFVARQR